MPRRTATGMGRFPLARQETCTVDRGIGRWSGSLSSWSGIVPRFMATRAWPTDLQDTSRRALESPVGDCMTTPALEILQPADGALRARTPLERHFFQSGPE